MSSAKQITALAVRAKTEASYGAGASMSFAGPDSVQVQEHVVLTEEYLFDGTRAAPPGSLGTQRRAAPSSLTAAATLLIELKGNGSGYANSGSRLPNMHSLLEASGLSGSLNASTWSFSNAPEADTPLSTAFEFYVRGELHEVSGAFANMSYTIEEAGPIVFSFDIQGIGKVPTDVARPSIVYEATTVIGPKADNLRLGLNFGGSFTTASIKSFAYAQNREIVQRLDLNDSTGFAGYAVGRRGPVYTITIEAEASATFDPYAILAAGTNGTMDFVVGTAVANTFEVSLAQCQIVNAIGLEDENGVIATIVLEIAPYITAGVNDDDEVFKAY